MSNSVRQGEREYEREGHTVLEKEKLKLAENIANEVAAVWGPQWLSSLWGQNDSTRVAQETWKMQSILNYENQPKTWDGGGKK